MDVEVSLLSPNALDGKWAHLYLTDWPFRVVPDGLADEVWADRIELKDQVDRLMWKWSRIDRSSIHIVWADLGAGKSHTLRYIQKSCTSDAGRRILPIYAVMPKQLKSFIEVYQAILTGFNLTLLAERFAAQYRALGSRDNVVKTLFAPVPDAVAALIALQSQVEEERRIAAHWLRAGGLTRKQMDSIKVMRAIKSTDDAVAVLGGLCQIMVGSGGFHRSVVMLDEFQRIGEFRRAIGQSINTGLQTLYDATPNGLTLVLTFGVGDEEFVRPLLSPEILDREERPGLSIPLLEKHEVLGFVKELLNQYRLEGVPDPWFPLTEEQANTIATTLTRGGATTPRVVMKGFEAIFEDADYRMMSGGTPKWTNDDLRTLVDATISSLPDDPG